MVALSHNLEALCRPSFSFMLDATAPRGLYCTKNCLPAAFNTARPIQTRVYTTAASIMAVARLLGWTIEGKMQPSGCKNVGPEIYRQAARQLAGCDAAGLKTVRQAFRRMTPAEEQRMRRYPASGRKQ